MLTDFRVRQRDYLLKISRAMTSKLDLPSVLRLVLEAAAEMLAGQFGLIALAQEDGSFAIQAIYAIPPAALPLFAPLLSDIPQASDPAEFAVPRLEQKLEAVERSTGLPLGRVVALPMIFGGQVLGVIYIFRAYGIAFSANDRAILASFADQVAIAVHNAQLYQQVAAQKQRLDALIEISADGVLILDPHGRITVFNKALCQMTGYQPQEALGREHDEVIHFVSRRTGRTLSEAEANGWPLHSAPSLYVEGDLRKKNGATIPVSIRYAALIDDKGRLLNIIGSVHDLTRFLELEQLKSTFISVISHELKTPVALIKGYAGTLRREDARWDPEVFRESLAVIEEESDRLNELINNLLDASRLQAGALKLEMGYVALDDLAESLAESFRTQTDNHLLVADFPPDFPVVPGDAERLRQVLSNLLSNAIKYSPRGGSIRISGRVEPDSVVVSVADEGIGLEPEESRRIFERFYRVENPMTRKTQGAGLGLYLARAVIEAHGGQIWVESKPGQGAIFSFRLPREERR